MTVVESIEKSSDPPLGCENSPFSTPDLMALLNMLSNDAPGSTPLLLAWTYFLRVERLWRAKNQPDVFW